MNERYGGLQIGNVNGASGDRSSIDVKIFVISKENKKNIFN